MNLNTALRISSSGLAAQRFRMDVISANIANANTMRVGNQDPYRGRDVVLTGNENGVQVAQIVQDQRDFRVVIDPSNPNADAEHKVYYSNVDPLEQMVNMMSASRAYEANIAAFNSAKGMMKAALSIGKA